MKFDEHFFENAQLPVKEIQGFENGSFNIISSRKDSERYTVQMYDREGTFCQELPPLDHVGTVLGMTHQYKKVCMMQNRGYAILTRCLDENEYKTYGRFLRQGGQIIHDGFTDLHVFHNNWYVLDHTSLYDSHDQLRASGFKQCRVFPDGSYALSDDDKIIPFATWTIYDKSGETVEKYHNVIKLVGNGNAIVRCEHQFFLKRPYREDVLLAKGTVEEMANGCFVWNTVTGEKQMYSCEGERMSMGIKDGEETFPDFKYEYLPDGKYIALDRGIVRGYYSDNGILIRREIWGYAIAGRYYFLYGENYKSYMYDENGKEIGVDFNLLQFTKDFCAVEKNNVFYLYNNCGKVVYSTDI